MRKIWAVLFVLLLAWPLAAQQRTGNIYGTVVDQEGNPLPGVTLTLTQRTIAAMTTISTAEGRFRFLSLFPAADYMIKAELSGFKPLSQSGVIVSVGSNSEIKLVMEMGKLEEQVTVTAITPMVETKKTAVTATVNYLTLQSLPSARDPWVIVQMTPSIAMDRENMGGNESGQQASYVTKGGSSTSGAWTLDGVNITDPAAIGASPTYYDFDIFEELQVTTSGADVETQVAGVALNMVTRRGGNRLTLGGRFYLTDEKFQNKISPAKILELGVPGYNRIIETKDFGFNMGGPVITDKVWWWGSYGLQDIKTTVIAGTRDDTLLTNMAAKLNFQLLPQNRAEVFLHAGKKEKFGRSASTANPSGWFQKGFYHFGSPIIKLQDEHMFGDNLFVSIKYGFTDAGFGMWPMNDQGLAEMRWYDVAKDLYTRSQTWFFSGRPNKNLSGTVTYFNDNLFGVSHEIKFGGEYVKRNNAYVSGYPGAMYVNSNYNTAQIDADNNGTRDVPPAGWYRLHLRQAWQGANYTDAIAGFISDTISAGRFNVKLGLRYDRQSPRCGDLVSNHIFLKDNDSEPDLSNFYEIQHKYSDDATLTALDKIFPTVKAPGVDPSFNWSNFSPRVGITWDVNGDGKTLAKVSGAIYGSYMGTEGWRWSYGGLGGWMNFWWKDANADQKFTMNELYWLKYNSARTTYPAFQGGAFAGNWDDAFGLMWGAFDNNNPTQVTPSYYVMDDNWTAERTWEALFTLEKELLTDFRVGLDVTYRKYDNFRADYAYYPDTNTKRNKTDYMVAGTIPATITKPDGTVQSTGDAAGKSWYVLKTGVAETDYTYVTNWPSDRNNTFFGIDLSANKRLSNKWMMNGSFSLGWQKAHYGDNGYTDPNNIWALEGSAYAYNIGASSGKLNQPVYTIWMAKLQALYQLPWDLDVSFTLTGRQGWAIPEGFTIVDYRLPNPIDQDAWVQTKKFDDYNRLPTMWYMNARLQKILRASERGRIYLMVDMFNVFNSDTLNRQRSIDYGTFYMDTGAWAKTARSGEPNEVLNPRVFRFGVRFEF